MYIYTHALYLEKVSFILLFYSEFNKELKLYIYINRHTGEYNILAGSMKQ